MTINDTQLSSVKAVASEFESIWDDIEQTYEQLGGFSDSDWGLLQYTTKTLKIQQRIALLKEKHPIGIFETDNCTLWYSCSKGLNKIQKELSLHWQNALGRREQDQKEKFYQKVESVWNRTTHVKTQGKPFFEENPSHVITTQAIQEFLFDRNKQDLIDSLNQKEWMKSHSIYSFLPPELKNAVDKKIYSLCQAKDQSDPNMSLSRLLVDCVTQKEEHSSIPLLIDYLEKTNLNSLSSIRLFPDFEFRTLTDGTADSTFKQTQFPLPCQIDVIVPDGPISQEMQEIMDLSQEAMAYALMQIRYSSNYVNRPETGFNQDNYTESELELIDKWIRNCKKGIGSPFLDQYWKRKFEGRNLNDFASVFVYDWLTSKIGRWFPFGNCYHLAVNALFYLLKKKLPHIRIERVAFKEKTGDHTFVLLRPKSDGNSAKPFDIKDPSTWGENSIVCDLWDRKIFASSLAYKYLKNYVRFDKKTGLPVLEDFNPELVNHVLESQTCDLLTSEEFLSEGLINGNKQEIALLLNDLHTAPSYEEKKEIALKILNLPFVDHLYMVTSKVLRTLICQLRFFVFNQIANFDEKQSKHFKNKC